VLELTDVLQLAPGVSVSDGRVHDTVRGASWPANDTARWLLGRSGTALGTIAGELSAAHGLPAARARDDVLSFAWRLNGELVVNLVPQQRRWRRALAWAALAARLAPAATLPPRRATRVALDTRTAVRACSSVARALRWRAFVYAVASAALVLQLVAVGVEPQLPAAAALGVGVGGGLVIHECGHAVALRGVAAALVVVGASTFVLHTPIGRRRRSRVALAGPLAAVFVGLVVVSMAAVLGVVPLALLGLPLCGHALSATVLSPDGRVACAL
jgi:hypothetical protein